MLRKLLALTAAGGAAAALAVPALAATKTVKIGDNFYVKKGSKNPTVTVSKGDTVKWVWKGKHEHNVFQIGGPGHFHSPTHKEKGSTFSHKFTTKGTYQFQCTYHEGQKMKVKVT